MLLTVTIVYLGFVALCAAFAGGMLILTKINARQQLDEWLFGSIAGMADSDLWIAFGIMAGVALGLALGDATLRPGITVADWLALAVPAWQALLLRWEAALVNAG